MTNKQAFINWVSEILKNSNVEMNEQAEKYWNTLQKMPEEKEKPMFTDNGKVIMKYIQENGGPYKAKEIADGIGLSSRTVSGAMRKLVNDGFVEKAGICGDGPVIYMLTEKGANMNIE